MMYIVQGLVVSFSALYLCSWLNCTDCNAIHTHNRPRHDAYPSVPVPVGGDHIVDHRVEVWVLEVFLEPDAVTQMRCIRQRQGKV